MCRLKILKTLILRYNLRMSICQAQWLGTVPYQSAWDLQNRLADEIAAELRPPTLLLLEHPHTFTFGRRGQAANLLWDEVELTRRGVGIHWVDRGGDVTYHGPGQLVGYPLIPLGPINASLHVPAPDYTAYLRQLEEVIIQLTAQLGVACQRIPGLTGVWSELPGQIHPAKIAAIGVKVDRYGVTRHGFALNLNPDMTYFEGIIACGLVGHPVTSLAAHLADPPTPEALAASAAQVFGAVFDYEVQFQAKPLNP
jgi:lipoate-protein ligase B